MYQDCSNTICNGRVTLCIELQQSSNGQVTVRLEFKIDANTTLEEFDLNLCSVYVKDV